MTSDRSPRRRLSSPLYIFKIPRIFTKMSYLHSHWRDLDVSSISIILTPVTLTWMVDWRERRWILPCLRQIILRDSQWVKASNSILKLFCCMQRFDLILCIYLLVLLEKRTYKKCRETLFKVWLFIVYNYYLAITCTCIQLLSFIVINILTY